MGNLFTKRSNGIHVLNVISKKDLKRYPNLEVKGEIIIQKYYSSSIPEIYIQSENYFAAVVCVWPNNFDVNRISTPLLI